MDVISTANLYEATKTKFSVGANRLVAFKASFLGAYNDCLMELYNEGYIDEPALLTDTDEDSALEIRFLPHIKAGIRHFIQLGGEWIKGDDVDKYAALDWERAKGNIANTLVADTQNDETYTGLWGETA